MPCRCDGFDDEPTVPEKDYRRAKKELDRLTRLLCYTCGEIMFVIEKETTSLSLIFENNSDLKEWWIKHKEDDIKRLKETATNYFEKHKNCTRKDIYDYLIKQATDIHIVSSWHKNRMFLDIMIWAEKNLIIPYKESCDIEKRRNEASERATYERLKKKYEGK